MDRIEFQRLFESKYWPGDSQDRKTKLQLGGHAYAKYLIARRLRPSLTWVLLRTTLSAPRSPAPRPPDAIRSSPRSDGLYAHLQVDDCRNCSTASATMGSKSKSSTSTTDRSLDEAEQSLMSASAPGRVVAVHVVQVGLVQSSQVVRARRHHAHRAGHLADDRLGVGPRAAIPRAAVESLEAVDAHVRRGGVGAQAQRPSAVAGPDADLDHGQKTIVTLGLIVLTLIALAIALTGCLYPHPRLFRPNPNDMPPVLQRPSDEAKEEGLLG